MEPQGYTFQPGKGHRQGGSRGSRDYQGFLPFRLALPAVNGTRKNAQELLRLVVGVSPSVLLEAFVCFSLSLVFIGNLGSACNI